MIRMCFEYFLITVSVVAGLGFGLALCAVTCVSLNFYLQKTLNYLEKIQEARNANH